MGALLREYTYVIGPVLVYVNEMLLQVTNLPCMAV